MNSSMCPQSSMFAMAPELVPISDTIVRDIQSAVANANYRHSREVCDITTCLRDNFTMEEESAIKLAIAIFKLVTAKTIDECYYTQRKKVSLPLALKIIVNKRYNCVHFMPKKDLSTEALKEDHPAQLDGTFKDGRLVHSLWMSTMKINSYWALTPKKDHDDSYRNFSHLRLIEPQLWKAIPDALPQCYFDYDYIFKEQDNVQKRLAVYEYYDKNDLFCFLNGIRANDPRRIGWFVQIVKILQKLHSQDIVWLDLKLENILAKEELDGDKSTIKFAFSDFDSAVHQGRGVRPREIGRIGSKEYESPELTMSRFLEFYGIDGSCQEIDGYVSYLRKCPLVDITSDDLRPCDIYSLGVVGLMMVSQDPSWFDNDYSSQDVLAQKMQFSADVHVKKTKKSKNKEVDQLVNYICAHMMCVNRKERHTIDQVVQFLENELHI